MNLVEHIYKGIRDRLREKNSKVNIVSRMPEEKNLPAEPFIVIQYIDSEPEMRPDGNIDLEMLWVLRYIRKIDDKEDTRFIVADAAWRIGAILNDYFLKNPFSEDEEEGEEGGIQITFSRTNDDDFDIEAQTFESWGVDLVVNVTVPGAEALNF